MKRSASCLIVDTAPFDIKDERARRRWMTDNHVDQNDVLSADRQLIGVTPLGIYFSRKGVVHHVTGSRNTPLAIIRIERFQPVAKLNGQGTTFSETETRPEANIQAPQFRDPAPPPKSYVPPQESRVSAIPARRRARGSCCASGPSGRGSCSGSAAGGWTGAGWRATGASDAASCRMRHRLRKPNGHAGRDNC